MSGSGSCRRAEQGIGMLRGFYPVFYVLAMIALIVGLDVLFFRDRFAARLVVNVGIVVVFLLIYLVLLRDR
jgi:hypothetical protein